MLTRLACLAVIALASSAYAGDAKIAEFVRLYNKEVTACRKDLAGLTKVKERGIPLAASDPTVAADLAIIETALKVQQTYCDDVAAALELLRADPKATYKSMAKQVDERDKVIRADRKASKKALADTQPVITRLVPKINAQAGAAAPTPVKKTPGTFPSGRTVDLPTLPGTWKVAGSITTDIAEYTDKKAVSTATVKAFGVATCDEQRKALRAKFALAEMQVDALAAYKPVFVAGYRSGKAPAERVVVVACIAQTDGGLLATLDTPATSPATTTAAIESVLVAMIAAFKP